MTISVYERAQQWRRHLHRHPEPGFAEHDTAAFVAARLREFGFDVVEGVGGTGVVGSLRRGPQPGGGASGPVVGLRADMDALTLTETTGLPYASTVDGMMHACGHDGHMAMLLGASAALATDGGFHGTVRAIFQPAEEHGRGARAMIDDGLFDRFPVDMMVGLHTMPGIPAGALHTRPGPIMASEDNFTITITGRGGHAARPQMVIDPLLVAGQTITGLQSIVARNVDPAASAVVSCTGITSDGTRNAIPTRVVLTGDTRSYSPQVRSLLEERIRTIAAGMAAAAGATAAVDYTHEFEPTVNDPFVTAAAVTAARAAVGDDRVDADCTPVMASEDFALYGGYVPTCFLFVGNGVDPDPGGAPLHSSVFDFNDTALRSGIDFYVRLVGQQLRGTV